MRPKGTADKTNQPVALREGNAWSKTCRVAPAGLAKEKGDAGRHHERDRDALHRLGPGAPRVTVSLEPFAMVGRRPSCCRPQRTGLVGHALCRTSSRSFETGKGWRNATPTERFDRHTIRQSGEGPRPGAKHNLNLSGSLLAVSEVSLAPPFERS